MYWWVRQYPVTQAAWVANGTAVDVYQWLREICSWRLINHDDMTLGGSGPVHTNVQIDESCFSHKPKVHLHCVLILLDIHFSIIAGMLQHLRYGSLVWLIPAILQHWDMCKWCTKEMLPLSFLLSSSTLNRVQIYTVTSGQLTIMYLPYQLYPPIVPSTIPCISRTLLLECTPII